MYCNVKIVLLTLILSLSLSAEPLYLQEDKQSHFVGSMAISGTATAIARHYGSSPIEAFFIGFGSAIIIGIAKEARDSIGNGTEDINDVYADALGATVGGIIFNWEF